MNTLNYVISIKKNLFTYCHIDSLSNLKMLRFVKNINQNRQFLSFKCFIIHVGLKCIGENAYA